LKAVFLSPLFALAIFVFPVQWSFAQEKSGLSAPPTASLTGSDASIATNENIGDLQQKAAAGDVLAQNNLGFAYAFGRGIEQNFQQAARWFTLSASAGFAPAQVNLGALYERGWAESRDMSMAIRWYRAAADLGEPHRRMQARQPLPCRQRRSTRRR
jgi:TPR repeat protein